MSAGAKPPQGLLVLALEQAVAAPYCTSRLADAGARVVEIERAEGDLARGHGAAVHGPPGHFVRLNRGEQGLVAGLEDPADAASLHRILARADGALRRAHARRGGGAAAPGGTAYGSADGVAGFAVHPASRRVEVGTPGGAARVAAPPAPVDVAAPALGPLPGVGEHTGAIRRGFGEGRG